MIWNTNKAVILWAAVINRNLREQFSGTATEGLFISRVFLSDFCAILYLSPLIIGGQHTPVAPIILLCNTI